MHLLLIALLLFSSTTVSAQRSKTVIVKKTAISKNSSPLARYSAEWNKPQYLACNTAKNALYLSAKEREVIYILNLLRSNPVYFAKNVLTRYPDSSRQGWLVNVDYYKSLMDTLLKMKPLNILKPDKKCFTSALCHAESTGVTGAVTHDRANDDCKQKQFFNGECIDFGSSNPLDIILHLMIDENVPSLGHRFICISSYKSVGVSIQPHKNYGHMAVLDFCY